MSNCEPEVLTALVVDADREYLSLLAAILQEAGCTPICFERGEPALAALRQRSFDVLVMAARLPDVDGIAMCIAARELYGDHAAILLLTTKDRINDCTTALNQGADDCVGKPFDVNELRARIEAKIRRVFGNTCSQIPRSQVHGDATARL
jgi:DNA-binding response OmpR family regulator